MSDALHPLLKVALEAHGGHDRWVKFKGIASTILTGGKLWELKGAPLIPVPRRTRDERIPPPADTGYPLLANRIGR
ncbi:hypothetical protein V1290_005984 [Bradyrhizobium sp. AZCC 1578]|uniref:hypothetical protein n=1 Tax=unclassified Bradyrhizobium TaxID=2631580 RepID=UPI002FEFD282